MKPELFDLGGSVAIVTGGNGGIGLGIARGLADAGAAIAIVGRDEAKLSAANAILPGWIDTDLTKRARADRRLARTGTDAHAGGALGRLGGFCRHRCVSLFARIRLRHGYRDPRRRRIFGHGIEAGRPGLPQ
jgi:hypothetical protein